MAITSRIEVLGVKECEAALTEFGEVKVPVAMRAVTVQGAKIMRASIKSAASSMFQGESKTMPGGLIKGVRYKAARGAKGTRYIVGPFGKGTAHRALVVSGHEIVGHAPNKTHTGKRTRPVPFVQQGEEAALPAAVAAIEEGAKAAIASVMPT